MNSRHRAASFEHRPLSVLLLGIAVLAPQAWAQDSTFLACARFEDRGQRIACLEDALEAAVGAPATAAANGSAAAPPAPLSATVAADSSPVPAAVEARSTIEVTSEERSLLDRLRRFGRSDERVNVSSDGNGDERLEDSISALEQRNGLWTVTLSSGQVWRQTYPRQYLLRQGDAISIYREGIGNGFRLATPRLSGFIRVERLR